MPCASVDRLIELRNFLVAFLDSSDVREFVESAVTSSNDGAATINVAALGAALLRHNPAALGKFSSTGLFMGSIMEVMDAAAMVGRHTLKGKPAVAALAPLVAATPVLTAPKAPAVQQLTFHLDMNNDVGRSLQEPLLAAIRRAVKSQAALQDSVSGRGIPAQESTLDVKAMLDKCSGSSAQKRFYAEAMAATPAAQPAAAPQAPVAGSSAGSPKSQPNLMAPQTAQQPPQRASLDWPLGPIRTGSMLKMGPSNTSNAGASSSSSSTSTSSRHLRVQGLLGAGAVFRVVLLEPGKDEADCTVAALKVVLPLVGQKPSAVQFQQTKREALKLEASVLKLAADSHIISLLGEGEVVVVEAAGDHNSSNAKDGSLGGLGSSSSSSSSSCSSSSSLCESMPALLLELCYGGTLKGLYEQHGPLPEAFCKEAVRQMLMGLQALHAHGIIWRDCKAENVLLAHTCNPMAAAFGGSTGGSGSSAAAWQLALQLADFGVSRVLLGSDDFATTREQGTLRWMAPEQDDDMPDVMMAIYVRTDSWGAGCTLLEMMTAQSPFCHVPVFEARVWKMDEWGEADQQGHAPYDGLPGGVKQFLCACLQPNVARRWTAKQLLSHPWMVS